MKLSDWSQFTATFFLFKPSRYCSQMAVISQQIEPECVAGSRVSGLLDGPCDTALFNKIGGLCQDKLGRLMWDPLESTCRHASLSIL